MLRDLVASPTWEAVITLLEVGAERQLSKMLKCSISAGDRELVLAKARLEGAETMIQFVESIKKEMMKE